jgi:AmiR/NasT family two-component response regulator
LIPLMISILLLTDAPEHASRVQADLARLGIHCVGAVACNELVRAAVQKAPDAIVVDDAFPGPQTFAALRALQASAPHPVVMFAAGLDGDAVADAIDAGVHALVFGGYDGVRMRPLVRLAQARFRHEQQLRRELADLDRRFDERKLVDRAKGILMRATQLPEEEAFRLLRGASMRDNRRVGQVSREVIDAARHAEAVNRAGQLRMLSQRLVKLHALLATGTDAAGTGALLAQTVERTDANLVRLAETLAPGAYADLVQPIQTAWKLLRKPLGRPADGARLAALDDAAENLLQLAEQLTASLELDNNGKPLHLVNVSGRQRMLSQRVVKLALLAELLPHAAAEATIERIAAAIAEFEASLQYLNTIPLATPETTALLATAQKEWATVIDHVGNRAAGDGGAGVRDSSGGSGTGSAEAGRLALAGASEALLATFDRLTAIYERSMTILTGPQAVT